MPLLLINSASVENADLWEPMTLAPVAERLAGELSLPVLTSKVCCGQDSASLLYTCEFFICRRSVLNDILPKVSLGIRLSFHRGSHVVQDDYLLFLYFWNIYKPSSEKSTSFLKPSITFTTPMANCKKKIQNCQNTLLFLLILLQEKDHYNGVW